MTARDKSHDATHGSDAEDVLDVASPADALWRDVVLDVAVELPLFGLRLRFESNAEVLHELVGESFEFEQRTADASRVDGATIRVRLVVEPTITRHPVVEAPQWRIPDADHALVRAPGLTGWLDLARGEAVLYVEEFRLRRSSPVRTELLRGVALSLATRHDRHPIHAAAVQRGHAALVICGPSGAGKSTLAFAASRDGVTVLSDDAVRVQLTPELRIWGSPGRVHLLDDARRAFADLTTLDLRQVAANAGTKHVVPLPYSGQLFARRARVCLVDRTRGAVERVPATPEEIVRAILDAPEANADMFPSGRRQAAEALAARGGWRLHLSNDVRDAVPHVLAMLDES